jgi:hypothetical protein
VPQRTELSELPCPNGLNNTNGKLTCRGVAIVEVLY